MQQSKIKNTMKHLFLFTIGPVQTFIAQARKVHDLAAGSKMLSDIIGWAMEYVKKEAVSYEFMFPNEKVIERPNRFLAIIQHDNIQDFGNNLEKHIRDKFQKEAQSYIKDFVNEYAFQQLADFPQIHWIANKYDEDENYKTQYERIEQLMGGIKNLRSVSKIAETGRKCAINGEYNVVIYRKKKEDDNPAWLHFTKPKVKEHKLNYSGIGYKQLAPGEGLSAISFLKRMWEVDSSFNATCQIAYLNTIQKLSEKEEVKKLIEELQNIDEQYLYEDANIPDTEITKDNAEKLRKEISEALKSFNKKNSTKLKFGKYYALLVFDADKMGEWLAGEYAKNAKEFQSHLSGQLGEFATKAREIVENKGQTIYAGGDDYIGFVALEHLFDVLKELRKGFKEMSDKLQGKEPENEEFTFSAGVAIAHYKTPLNFVLNQAREAEKTAKIKGGRNSIAITVLKRSGEIHKTFMKWYDKECFLPESMFEIVKAIKNNVSNKFITNFTAEFLPVLQDKENEQKENLFIYKYELHRLLSENQKGKCLSEHIDLLFDNFKPRIHDFMYMLNIADFISREINSLTINTENK